MVYTYKSGIILPKKEVKHMNEKYSSKLDIYQTQMAISYLKKVFEENLSSLLNLKRVSAPLFVNKESGLNDNLNGVERPVSFDIKNMTGTYEVVHSLAKWKRLALHNYHFVCGEGLYTDMNAIRRDEELEAASPHGSLSFVDSGVSINKKRSLMYSPVIS